MASRITDGTFRFLDLPPSCETEFIGSCSRTQTLLPIFTFSPRRTTIPPQLLQKYAIRFVESPWNYTNKLLQSTGRLMPFTSASTAKTDLRH